MGSQIEIWCNGSTTDSGSVSEGSSPSISTKFQEQAKPAKASSDARPGRDFQKESRKGEKAAGAWGISPLKNMAG